MFYYDLLCHYNEFILLLNFDILVDVAMDAVDKQLLRELQTDARLSNAALAERVNLSATPCLRRWKRLEQQGYIRRYHAELDRQKVGLTISAFVFVQLERNSEENARLFEAALENLPQVIDCFVLAGAHDYMLRVVERDLASYERFVKTELAGIKQVSRLDTSIILNEVMSDRPLPL